MNDKNYQVNVGDTIGLVTPSSPLFPGRLEAAVTYFEAKGFKVKVGKYNRKIDRFLAGSDEERAEDLMTFFADPDVKAIIATGGGAGSIRTLPYLDYEIIKKNHKPLIGFSDTTALQLGIYKKTGLISYSGFTCKDIANSDALDPLIENTLTSCLELKDYHIQQGETVNPGLVTAPLIGGNLMCLMNLMGTSYQPDFCNKIFFFEEVWAEPYVVDGMMAQLWLAGILDQVAGVVIGKFTNCDAKFLPERDGTIDEVINDWVKKIRVPCIKNFPYGHSDSRCVLPIGQQTTLDADNISLSVNFCRK